MDFKNLFGKEVTEQFTKIIYKTVADLPEGWRYATLEDAPVIEQYIGQIIIEAFPSKYFLESLHEMMVRAGREAGYTSHNVEIWHLITRYFKEKNLVEWYVVGMTEYVLVNNHLLLQFKTGRDTGEFSLRSEIKELYDKYAGDRFISMWEERAFNSYERMITNKYIEKFCNELEEECVQAARRDLKIMLSHSFVTAINGYYDFDKDTVEFHVVSRGGSYPASVYIEEEGYKTGIFKAVSKQSKTQQAVVSVIFENVRNKKDGNIIPIIRNYQRPFNNLNRLLKE